ncbi:hypothetical protein Afil01_33330 [Actinorhabdospora filicis]|uniref:Cysteine-rich CPCC domain-containing protein n=1 Tax=Actinorhabdospora filicis TaxID=1785913 RepID=A0A9W6SMF9_9ACTN|nr:hypothetical protein Afil01_33330 [Actinorhabdospora filicis]
MLAEHRRVRPAVLGRVTIVGVSVKFPCVCCGHLTMDSPPGLHDICRVCFWEDDGVQLRWPGWWRHPDGRGWWEEA